jgi:stage V sporulation protein T
MRATGIVRRIDDLGRVVIPKEIRRQMKIREGDPLEIFLEGKMVCFQPYSPIDTEQWEVALRIAKTMLKDIKFAILNSYGEVMGANAEKVVIDNNKYFTEIVVDAEVVGYVHSLEDNVPQNEIYQTAQVLGALFAEE